MFRIPSFSEIISLFYQPTKVAQAIRGIETAAQRADSVVDFNLKRKEAVSVEAGDAQRRAAVLTAQAADHDSEASRAARVSTRLRELTA